MFKVKTTDVISLDGWLISNFPTAILSIAHTIPSMGVWMCIFQGTVVHFPSANSVMILLSTRFSGMDSAWPYQATSVGGIINIGRILTVTDLTNTIFPVMYIVFKDL